MNINRFHFNMYDLEDKKYIRNVHRIFNLNECIENENFILLRHTNKVDKNGNTIVEGDILRETFEDDGKITSDLLIIAWDEETQAFGFKVKPDSNKIAFSFVEYLFKPENVEIVGNVFENADLFENEQ